MIEAGAFLQGRYRVERQIGEGGMGAVFVATDERFGSTVAIKETFFSDEQMTKAFEREARLLNSLRHPALPRVSDHFIEGKGQFIVMEYIAGEDLSAMMLKRRSAFPIGDVLDWADQLLDALDYLHTQETPVIHRDIKPQNLKLTPRGQIILLDFGLAKGNPTSADSPTAAKSVFGYSRSYASLEQIQGTGTDPRSDLYSLAATLYHLATGTPPADALTRAMGVLNGEKDPLIPPHMLHEQVTEAVSEVLMRAMALNANHRPSSAAAMRELLREAAARISSGARLAVAENFGAASLFTQNTEVMADAPVRRTGFGEEFSADLMTEQETAVRNLKSPVRHEKQTNVEPLAAVTASGKSRRGFVFGSVALAGLLAVGATASGVYMYNSEFFGSGADANLNVEKKIELTDAAKENDASDASNANVSPGNSSAGGVSTAETENRAETIRRENAVKAEERNVSAPAQTSARAEKDAKQSSKTANVTKAGKPKTSEMDDDEVILKGGRIETKDVIIDGDRLIFKDPKQFPVIPQEEFRKLTPEQQKKVQIQLQQLYRIQRNMPVIPKVAPPPVVQQQQSPKNTPKP